MSCIEVKKGGKVYYVELPPSELTVLEVLVLSEGITVPKIAEFLKGTKTCCSSATVYSLVERLKKKKLAKREDQNLVVAGTLLKRVIWTQNFDSMKKMYVVKKLPD